MELIDGDLRVEFIGIGEGYCGDYDETDPDDKPLLRFYVSRRGNQDADEEEWVDLDDGSYCTAIPEDTPEEELQECLRVIMVNAKAGLAQGEFKRTMELVSWLGDPAFEALEAELPGGGIRGLDTPPVV